MREHPIEDITKRIKEIMKKRRTQKREGSGEMGSEGRERIHRVLHVADLFVDVLEVLLAINDKIYLDIYTFQIKKGEKS